jgi:hypothetical protein
MRPTLWAFLNGALTLASANSDGTGAFTSPDFRFRVVARKVGPQSYRYTFYRGSGSGAAYDRISREEFKRLLAVEEAR